MTKDYSSVEVEATSVDTKTQLTTLGQDGTVTPILVPSDAKELEAIIVSVGPDHAAAGSCSALVRLEGGGLPGGPYTIGVGAGGSESTTGASSLNPAKRIPLGLPVSPGDEILVHGEMCGEDIGSVHFGVTLVFSLGVESMGGLVDIITVEGDLASADTKAALTTQGSTAAPSRSVVSKAKKIKTIIAAVAPDLAGAGAAGFLLRLSGKAVKGGEQDIFIAGAGGALVQSGADPVGLAMSSFVLEDADIDVQGGNPITIQGEMCGDDLGDAHMVVTLIFC